MLKKRNIMPEVKQPVAANLLVQRSLDQQPVTINNCHVLSLLDRPSVWANQQLKAILTSDHQPVLQLDEGDLRLTPVDFANQISRRLANVLEGLSAGDVARLVIVYAPRWAAECRLPADAQRIRIACRQIRDLLQILYDHETAGHVQIIYGGFVFDNEVASVLRDVNVDGILCK